MEHQRRAQHVPKRSRTRSMFALSPILLPMMPNAVSTAVTGLNPVKNKAPAKIPMSREIYTSSGDQRRAQSPTVGGTSARKGSFHTIILSSSFKFLPDISLYPPYYTVDGWPENSIPFAIFLTSQSHFHVKCLYLCPKIWQIQRATLPYSIILRRLAPRSWLWNLNRMPPASLG